MDGAGIAMGLGYGNVYGYNGYKVIISPDMTCELVNSFLFCPGGFNLVNLVLCGKGSSLPIPQFSTPWDFEGITWVLETGYLSIPWMIIFYH
jgi:hypothetical protein